MYFYHLKEVERGPTVFVPISGRPSPCEIVPGAQIVERGGQWGASFLFLREFFSRALLSERLEQPICEKGFLSVVFFILLRPFAWLVSRVKNNNCATDKRRERLRKCQKETSAPQDIVQNTR